MKKYSLPTRVLAMLLIVVMLMGMLPVSVLSAEAAKASMTEITGNTKTNATPEWINGVLAAGDFVANYIECYNELPDTVAIKVSEQQTVNVSMANFMYLGSQAIQALYEENTSAKFACPTYNMPEDATGQKSTCVQYEGLLIDRYDSKTCTINHRAAYVSSTQNSEGYNEFGSKLQDRMTKSGSAPDSIVFGPAAFTFAESIYTMARILRYYEDKWEFMMPITVARWYTYWVSFSGFSGKGKIYRVSGDNSTQMPTDGKVVAGGESKRYRIEAENGYYLKSLTVNGEQVELDADNSFTTKAISTDMEIKAEFVEVSCEITTTYENGTVEIKAGNQIVGAKVGYGTEIEIFIKPNDGYEFGEKPILINGNEPDGKNVTFADGKLIVKHKVTSNTDIIVSFNKKDPVDFDSTEFEFYGTPVRTYTEGNTITYIFKENADVGFKTTRRAIVLGEKPSTTVSTKDIKITQDTKVTQIWLGKTVANPGWNLDFLDWDLVEFPEGITTLNIVFDKTAPNIDVKLSKGERLENNAHFNGSITPLIVVEDPVEYSGLASVEYKLLNGTQELQKETITITSETDRRQMPLQTITAEADTYQEYKLIITATDKAGKTANKEISFAINTILPSVELELVGDEGEKGYYKSAELEVSVRDKSFSEAYLPKLMVNEKEVAFANKNWTETNDGCWVNIVSLPANDYTGKYEYKVDFEVVYTSQFGTTAEVTPNEANLFYILNADPTGTLTWTKATEETMNWSNVRTGIDLGEFWIKDTTLNALDFNVTSPLPFSNDEDPISSIDFYVHTVTKDAQEANVTEITDWKNIEELKKETFSADTKLIIYMRITDKAGNECYICSDRIMIDTTAPKGHASINCMDGVEGFCKLNENGEVVVALDVYDYTADAEGNKTSSGIQSITYDLYDLTASSETILTSGTVDVTEGTDSYAHPFTFKLDGVNTKIKIVVTVTDRAGWISTFTDTAVIDTKTDVALEVLTPATNGFHTSNVEIAITAQDVFDVEHFAGIKEIRYYVDDLITNKTTQEGVLTFKYDNDTETWIMYDSSEKGYVVSVQPNGQPGTLATWSGILTVNAEANNNDKISVIVVVEDCAGNKATKNLALNIKNDDPEMKIEGPFTEEVDSKKLATVKITLTDRVDAYAEKIMPVFAEDIGSVPKDYEGLVISFSAVDSYGFAARGKPLYEKWIDNEDGTYTLELKFQDDANYTCEAIYTNKAGQNVKDAITFTLDNQDPEASLSVRSEAWNQIAEVITFGIFDNAEIAVFGKVSDATSGIASVEYFKAVGANTVAPYSFEELNRIPDDEWLIPADTDYTAAFKVCNLEKEIDERVVVYLKVTDKSGRVTYVSTDGLIVDAKAPEALTVTAPEPNAYGYYSHDVILNIDAYEFVSEEGVEERYDFSGIKEIAYEVYNPTTGETTQQGKLFSFETVSDDQGNHQTIITEWTWDPETESYIANVTTEDGWPEKNQLRTEWFGKLTVDADKNNGEGIAVKVTVTDNAGNQTESEVITLNINTHAPKMVVTVDGKQEVDKDGFGYFDSVRTATITLEEREDTLVRQIFVNGKRLENGEILDNDLGLKIQYTAVDHQEKTVEGAEPVVGSWVNNGDGTYTLQLKFEKDAYYEWSVSYSNKSHPETTSFEMTWKDDFFNFPDKFVIDTEDPEAEIYVGSRSWICAADIIFFGIFENNAFDIRAKVSDETTGIASVTYYTAINEEASALMDKDTLKEIPEDQWQVCEEQNFDEIFKVCTIDSNERVVIYLKVIDGIGRPIYINSNGVVFDNAEVETIHLTPTASNGVCANGYYNADVNVQIDVAEIAESGETWTDPDSYSGIQKIEYAIEKNGAITESITLYEMIYTPEGVSTVPDDVTDSLVIKKWNGSELVETVNENRKPTADDLLNSWTGSITVNASDNNSDQVKVHVTVTDLAGNVDSNLLELKINCTSPEMEVSFGDKPSNTDGEGYGYFQKARAATIKIKDRSDTFTANLSEENMGAKIVEGEYISDPEKPFYGLVVEYTATDVNGNALRNEKGESIAVPVLGEWSYGEDGFYTATLTFPEDANYTWDISYNNKAAMTDEEVIEKGASFDAFTVDTTDPTGSLIAKKFTWSSLLNIITFGLYSQDAVRVDGTVADNTSPIQNVYWYKVTGKDAESALRIVTTNIGNETVKALSDGENVVPDSAWTLCNWTDSGTVHEINSNEKAVIYLKIMDMSNRVTYISTGGMIVDIKEPSPTLQINVDLVAKTIYNSDVRIPVKVNDLETGDVTSGISRVSYWVYNEDAENPTVPTQTGDLLIFDTTRDDKGNPVKVVIKEWNWEKGQYVTIKTIEDGLLRPEDIYENWSGEIIVDAEKNNSNNIRVEVRAEDNSNRFKEIEPLHLAIDITNPKIHVAYNSVQPDSEFYYSRDRVATVTITERNFDPNAVDLRILGGSPARSGWTTVKAGRNGDATTHTMTITYHSDGDYTFDIDYTDKAGNPADSITMVGGNETKFTIDQTVPVIKVTYDNNAVANEKYFKAHRTATIEITEHNFTLNRVEITQSATRGGEVPKIAWEHTGDSHTATIVYDIDGDYVFDIEMRDLAGNENAQVDYSTCAAPKDFVIDTTFEDMVSYSGVDKGKAYGRDDNVVPEVKIEDINLEKYSVILTGAQKGTKIDLTEEANALLKTSETLVEGIFDIFEMAQENDGIYTLTIYGKDLAGNEDQEEIVFTVNRFGSVYIYNDYLIDLIADGGSYVESVTEDLEITEFNADKLLEGSLRIEITRDGRPVESPSYTCSPEINNTVAIGESGWYQYHYVIDKSNFALDGVYKISISSADATGNTPENNQYEDLGIVFRVDSTKAELTSIVGLENDIINKNQVTVTYDVFDAIGIQSVEIYVNGELVDQITDFTADMNNYSGSFVLNESNSQQTVRIVVTDMSGNVTDTDADDFTCVYAFHNKVTVSTNFFVRWYANKPLFWGSVAGATAVGLAFWIFLLFKRKKKEDEDLKIDDSKAVSSSGKTTGKLK